MSLDQDSWTLPRPLYLRAKITAAQRQEIKQRLADGEDPKDLALEYGITASYVRQLRH